MNDTKKIKRGKGRPKHFDRDAVLKLAMGVFCQNGYQGSSMAELSKAMGMNPPSIYHAFTDKEHLFIEVLDYYHAPYLKMVNELFATDATIQARMKELFNVIEAHHSCNDTQGCLIVNSGIASSDESTLIGKKIKKLHRINEDILCDALTKAQDKGEISENANIQKIACYINAVFQGAAVTARGQHSCRAVKDILDQGYKSFLSLVA
ncbi:MAG: TetR/AcrR family transcriptional regulator [Rickettsiales bacterium]|nr:TetR/AcrR family transcriptional regulator [Rickettsiales bacterium]